MDPKSLDLPQPNFEPSQLAFDSSSQSLLLANGSNLLTYNFPAQSIISQTTLGLPQLSSSEPSQDSSNSTQDPLSLRLVPVNPNAKVFLSPSGLLATSQAANETVLVTTTGFNSGQHYWEIICPKSCLNIQIGIIKEGWSSSGTKIDESLFQVYSFKTTTSRVVGVKLDLENGELRFWLNSGVAQTHKTTKNIPYGTWYPCVKIKGVGTHVIYNPFATDPESSISVYTPQTKISVSQIESSLSQFVIFNGFSQLHKNPVDFATVFTFENENGKFAPVENIIDSTGSMVAFRFKNGLDAENFAQANVERTHNGKSLYFLDSSTLVASITELYKKEGDGESDLFTGESQAESLTKILTWVKRNLLELSQNTSFDDEQEIRSVVQLSEEILTKGASKGEVKETSTPLEGLTLKYMNKGDGLLVSQGNQLKLLHKENGKFVANAGLFANAPRNPKDEIILTLSRAGFVSILSQLDLKTNSSKLFNHKTAVIAAKEFLTAVKNGLSQETQDINIKVQYKHAKIFVNNLLASLFNSLKWLKSVIQDASETLDAAKGKSIQAEKSPKDKNKTEKRRVHIIFKNLSINQIYYILHTLLNIDESLYAMTLHNQASAKLKKYWPGKRPRLFTAFARLGTLLTYPSSKFSLVQIAEAGLYNTQDILYDVKHFLDPEKRIEELQNLRGDEDLWSLLQKSLVQNRMVQGLPSENVPLHVSLNNLPSKQHSTESDQKILNIATNDKTSLISTVSENGEVKVWNTELTLVELGASNFRKNLTSKKSALLKTSAVDETAELDLEVEEIVEKKPSLEAQLADFVPDEELMDMLLSMGFEYEISKRALFEVNNSNVDSAIEKMEKIQIQMEKEKKTTKQQASPVKSPKVTAKKITYDLTKIKATWECAACTFVNTNGIKFCDICGCQAPITAYFRQDELEEEEKPQEEQKPEVVAPTGQPETKETKPEEVPQRPFLETAKVFGNFIVPLQTSPISPAIIGVIFEENTNEPQKYQIRLRRFAYQASYVSQFVQKDKQKGQYSLISGAWFNQDTQAVHEHLTNEYGLAFSTLYPIFTETPKKILDAFDEIDFNIESSSGKLVSVQVLSEVISKEKEVAHVYLLWENNSKYTLQQIDVTNLTTNPYENLQNKLSYEIKTVFTQGIDIKGKFLQLEATSEYLIIVTDQQVQSFKPLKLEAPVGTFSITGKMLTAQLINSNTIVLFGEKGASQIIRLETTASKEDTKAITEESSSTSLQVPDIASLTEDNIDSICKSLHQKPLEGVSFQGDAVIQSNLQKASNKNSRFFLAVDSNTQGQNLEVNFERPTSLTNVEISLFFDLFSNKQLETIDEEKDLITNLQRKESVPQESSQKDQKSLNEKESEVVIPNLNMTEGDATDKFLPLTVNSFKGASQSENYPVSKLLSLNNDVFCANYASSEFVFQHLHEKTMLVKSVTVHSKVKPVGKNSYPIGSGLVFTANYLSHLDMTSSFHNMQHDEFQDWFKTRSEKKEALQPWEPVGSFEITENNESVTVNLAYTRPCKYIMLKPTSMRKTPEDYSKKFNVEPIEIKFFGASGSVVADEVTTESQESSENNLGVAKGVEVILEGQTKEKRWITIHTSKDVSVQSVVDNVKSLQKNWESLSVLPLWGSSLEVVNNEVLFQGRFNKIRVRVINAGNKTASNWVLSGVSFQAYTTNRIEEKASLGTSPAVLRNLLLDAKEFNKLNLTLIKALINPEFTSAKRGKIATLITEILTLEPNLSELFYKNLDLKSFLQNSILQERNNAFLEIQGLLHKFSTQKAFAQNLLEAIINVLSSLSNINSITLAGLNGFFSLLSWCQTLQPNQVFTTLLTELHKLAKKISQVRAPEYNILRSQYKVLSYVLDPELFSETNVSLKQTKRKTKEEPTEKLKEKTPLKSTFLTYYSHDIDEYLIDLGQKCNVNEIRLAFDHSTKALRFRVQIWALSDKNTKSKNLIHSKFYTEATWLQLTSYAYDRHNIENHYKSTEELECLGFSNLATTARYLKVQVTYSLLPFILLPTEKNDKKLIPEVYGEPIANETGEIAEIQALFNIKNKTQKDAVSYSHSLKYDKAEVSGKNVTYKYLFTSGEAQTKPSTVTEGETTGVQDNEEILRTQLQELQSTLLKKIQQVKESNTVPTDQDEVSRLSGMIEDLQVRLLNINSAKATPSQVKFSSSLDYLYTLAYKISQAISKLDTSSLIETRPWRSEETWKGANAQKIVYEIFENLIAYENGPSSAEFIHLLSDILVSNLNDKERNAFVLAVIDNFLAAPIKGVRTYSHLHIIEALNQISVSSKELLAYVINKLKISTEASGAKKLASEEDFSKISTLVSVLLLLNKQAPAKATEEKTEKVEKSAQNEKIRQAYYICIWICQHLSPDNNDTANVLSLGLDILIQTLTQGENTGVRDVLKDSQSFLKLFLSVVRINSPELLTKFQNVLRTILESKAELIDEGVSEEIKTLLVGHLQTALKLLTNYVINSERIPLDGEESQEELSVDNWLNNICFILEFLLPDSKKSTDETQTKSKVLEQSQSESQVSIQGESTNNLETKETGEQTKAEKVESVPIETLNQLVLLLSTNAPGRAGYNLGNSTKAWSLVMKSILSVKPEVFVETKLFDNLVKSFLSVPQDTQNVMFNQVIRLSKKLIATQSHQKEFSTLILSVLFNVLDSFTDRSAPIGYLLIKGWLDILLTGESPKPENLINKALDKAYSLLSEQGALILLTHLSKYLWNNLNFGAREGVQCSSDINLIKLQIGENLLRFLVLGLSSTKHLALGELFSDYKKYSKEIQTSIRYYIQWYLLNKTTEAGSSPSTDSMKNLSESIVRLFEIVDENQDVVKLSINSLVAGCKEVDRTISRLQASQQISAYLAFQYSVRSCSVLEELFNLWINNDTIASYAVLEVKCFEYLLEKMSFISDASSTSVSTSGSSYLKGTDLLSIISSTKTSGKDQVRSRLSEGSSSGNVEPPKEEEFANKLTIINQENQTWSGITPDWTTNKKGAKARVLFFVMNGTFYNEYSLLFKLDKTVELGQIRIGFNTSWTEYTDKSLGIPSNVIIEAGTSENDLTYFGTLSPLTDSHYSEYAVKVFGKNFRAIHLNNEQSIESAIGSVSQKKISYLKFRFQRPVVNVIEGLSTVSTNAYKNIAVSISFISIAGIDVKKLTDINRKVVEIQEKSALQTISKLCNPQFIKTMEIIANERAVISNIKSSFDTLSSLLTQHESMIAPIFLALASYNTEMGDWIINKFLDQERAKEHTKIIAEIALSNDDFIVPRTLQIHNFILPELKKILLLSKSESMSKFNRLVPFIEVFCTVLRSIPVEFAQKNADKPAKIPFNQENLDVIIQSYEQYNASTHSKLLIKLMLIYLYTPAPFALEDQGLIKYALEKLWSLVNQEKKFLYYEMLGPLIVGSTFSAKWFINHTETALNDILASLENIGDANLKTLRYSFTLLNNISSHDLIKKKLFANQWHLKLYDSLKNKDPKSKKLLKKVDTDILRLSVDFLKNVTLGYPQAEEDLAKSLIADIDQLDTNKDFFFVNNLLVPLLNAETEIPICLYPKNSQTGRVITDLKRLPAPKTISTSQTTQTLKSQILSDTQTQTLLKTIQTLTTNSGASKKLKNSSWELACTNSTDGENLLYAIKDKLSKKGPFLIILQGLNAGNKCTVGVFSSQSIPELQHDVNTQEDMSYAISLTDDNFIFYYSDTVNLHFPIQASPEQENFGTLQTFYDGGGSLSFLYNSLERVFLSFSSYQPTFVELSLADMKTLDTDNKQGVPENFLEEFVFQSAEYWVLKSEEKPVQAQQAQKVSTTGENDIINSAFLSTWHNTTQPFNYFRATPVYNVPSTLSAEKLSEIALNSDVPLAMRLTKENLAPKSLLGEVYEFLLDKPETNGIIDLEFDAFQMLERKLPKKAPNAITGEPEELKYKPALTFFETFEKQEGVKKIIDVGLRAIETWKDKSEAKKWKTWLQELSSFGALPNFFGLFLKNKDCMNLLFKILTGGLDKTYNEESSPEKKVDEEEQKAVRYSYQIIAEVFGVDNDPKLREYAIEKQFFIRILDRISIISKEGKRKWYDDYKKKEQEEEEKSSPEKKGEKTEEGYTKKIAKKKGVGYASDNTGENQKWNVSEYVESKKSKNEQLQATLEILANFLEVKDWHPPQKVLHQICESSLLPLLEAAFRSASLLDMAKEAPLNHAYLKLARAIAPHKALLPCLLELDRHYQPPQKDSIYTLLTNLKDLAQIFLNCLTAADKESAGTNQKLAQDILDTYKVVDAAIQNSQEFEEGNEAEILDILAQPLQVAYRTLLQNLRFDYVNMKDMTTSKFNHHYASYINDTTPSQQKMVRLAQELADLSTALPIEHTNSIFVRVDESRVDVMKAIIMGAAGTPYGHGAFEYDIYFDDSYPNAPPKVNLTTTGSGKVRFNPNLYHCGKVCLSLLGTWRGNASENWDPKLSTLLQVLVSIQAIIMSEEIYFNEPGYEGEAGTEEGEKKNEAYCNVVRYCNIKYAMIDQIKNPPKGFETVVRRHFYLKKNEILEECQKWIKYAEHRGASYNGLVNDHNSSWCTTFKASKNKYKEMLVEAIKELEKELNKLQPPSGKDVKQKVLKKKEKKAQKVNIEAGVANLEDIDVTYEKDQIVKHKEMDIQDESVKDRWSRYIGAMGLDAVTKQANATIFISGLGALGLEIVKNIVLSGVKRLTIHDAVKTTYRDLSGQFFLGDEDLGKNRAEASLNKIQQLNYYVKVDTALLNQKLPKDEAELDKILKGYTLVILTENDYETQIAVNEYCRKNKIYFISTDTYGPFAKTFSDFGEEFVVLDKNGEELQEVMIGSITSEEKGVVTLLQGHNHKFEDGDLVVLHSIEGMDAKEGAGSINNTQHTVEVINASSFRIGDTRGYTDYVRNGLAKPLKTPVSIKFKSLKESLEGQIPFDGNMVMHDFLKINHPTIIHVAFQALDQFIKKNSALPKSWNVADSDQFLEIAHEVAKTVKDFNSTEDKRFDFVLRRFAFTCQGVFAPLNAFLGGYIAQEAVKAITQKFMPTQQFFYTDCFEVIPELPEEKEKLEEAIKKLGVQEKKHRSDGLRICVGEELLEEMKYTSLFMVGAGAIGCELLKNYAMLGIGTGEAGKNGRKEGGKILLTDPDVIEVSNLNRQFLFREKHLRKPKSQTAAAAAIQMNKDLKGHVIARLDKVHEGTANIFTDKFFEELTVVTNALDNVQARRYIDLRCVNAKIPLLESGTLGPKGHVQVIIPYKTESYSSQEDPKDEAEIPHCTLKMFPEETLHCVEWARDKFGKLFTQRPKGLLKFIESNSPQTTDPQEVKALREAATLLTKKPSTFDDCIRYARLKFQKYFVNDIRQLLYTYPLDFKTKEGRPFWSLPKRPPTEIAFDPKNILHASFITACACLRANVFNIPIPGDVRKDSGKLKIAEEAAKIKVPDFKPSDEKAKEINSEVKKDEAGDVPPGIEEDIQDEGEIKENEIDELLKKISAFAQEASKDKEKTVKPEEFEKDNDQNFHIDFIYAIANCRASNYKLEPMEWITVKLKAGRIVPALATTTACVAGLQTIELCKLLKKCKVDDMKNAFLSLAVPILALSEPGVAPKTKLSDKLEVNIWDRWDVKLPRDATLRNLFDELEKTYDLKPKDVTHGTNTVYFHALMDIKGKEKEKEEKLNSKLEDLLGLEKEDKYVDLSVMFSRKGESEILKGVPFVRATLG